MTVNLTLAAQRAAELDRVLKPIAERPVDIDDPLWERKLRDAPLAIDEAGVRAQAEALMSELLDCYSSGSIAERSAVRAILRDNRAFTWATPIEGEPHTMGGFRRQLLRISAADGVLDYRDATVEVAALCATAREHGIDIQPILREIAEISSSDAADSGDSMQQILARAR